MVEVAAFRARKGGEKQFTWNLAHMDHLFNEIKEHFKRLWSDDMHVNKLKQYRRHYSGMFSDERDEERRKEVAYFYTCEYPDGKSECPMFVIEEDHHALDRRKGKERRK